MFVVTFLILSLVLNLFLIYKLYQFLVLILNFESNLEKCLNILEEKHNKIEKILEKEIFFDSIEVRQTISSIQESYEAIVEISNILTDNVGVKIEEKDDQNSE